MQVSPLKLPRLIFYFTNGSNNEIFAGFNKDENLYIDDLLTMKTWKAAAA